MKRTKLNFILDQLKKQIQPNRLVIVVIVVVVVVAAAVVISVNKYKYHQPNRSQSIQTHLI
jgi:hypothetical protein